MSEIGDSRIDPSRALAALASLVDSENPWLGLDSFTEETRRFFHGRDSEIAELARRVQRKLLTVLFGQSGLGKTSILRAGIVPRLRRQGYCPAYVRIDYSAEAPRPSEQIKQAIFAATASWGNWSRPGAAIAGESLWEFLHHRDDVLRDSSGKPLTPILIFDQFEEIFTLAQDDDAGRKRAAEFIEDLADLIENRAPKALDARIEHDDTLAGQFDFARADYRILISLREDYLAHLEGLKTEMPSITQNRMRLARMTGKQALEAVMKPGGDLVSGEVAESIVRFVAGDSELANAEVEPALLSLVCRELNNARVAQGCAEISADLLEGSRDSILTEFYKRALADQPTGVRRFIEDEMLTESGYRENIAEERVVRAFAQAGAAPNAVAALVNRRLLRIEERLDMRRVELTHDVLCDVVKASRDLRQQGEALEENERLLAEQRTREAATRKSLRRARQIAAGCAILAIAAIASALFGYQSMKRAQVAEAAAQRTHAMAEDARSQAEKLLVYMLDDLYLELEPVGRLDVVGELAKRAIAYYAALPPELRTKDTERNRALAFARSGGVQVYQGKFDEGGKSADEAIKVLRRLRAEGDHSEATAIGLSLALTVKYLVLAEFNKSGEAEEIAEAAAVLSPFMSAKSPSDQVRRAYGGVMIRQGRWHSNSGRKAESIECFERSRTAYRSIDDLALRDLAAAAGFADASGDLAAALIGDERAAEARPIAEEGVRVAGEVLARRPGYMPALRAHALNLSALATLEDKKSHSTQALAYRKLIEQDWEAWLKLDPGNADAAVNLVRAREAIADNFEGAGRPMAAMGMFRAIMVMESNPAVVKSHLAWVAGQLATLEANMGDYARAKKTLADCRRFIGTVANDMGPGVQGAISSHFCTYHEGLVGYVSGDYAGARAAMQRYVDAIEEAQRLEKGGPPVGDFVLTWGHHFLAEALYNLGDYAEAEREIVVAQGYQDRSPVRNLGDRMNQSAHRTLLAQILVRRGHRDEAWKLIEPEIALFRKHPEAKSDLGSRAAFAEVLYTAALASPERKASFLAEAAALLDKLPVEVKRGNEVARLRRAISEAS